MPVVTALYLTDQEVQAAAGSVGWRHADVRRVARAELPQGCVVNGMAEDPFALSRALKLFFSHNGLPAHRVRLVLDGSFFALRVLTLPTLAERKLGAVVARELCVGSHAVQPLTDYMVLRRDHRAHQTTVLAARVEKSVLDCYLALARDAELKLCGVDAAPAALARAAGMVEQLRGGDFLLAALEGEGLYAARFTAGLYQDGIGARLFNTRGTAASGAEIRQKLALLLQRQPGPAPKVLYFCGAGQQELEMFGPACAGLGLRVAQLPQPGGMALPQGVRLCDAVHPLGGLLGG